MVHFLKGSELSTELERLIEDAQEYIFLICPFFQLHEKIKQELIQRLDQPELKIVIVFGKNEGGLHKSLCGDDFEFLRQFPNVEIRYEPKLHAKYYSNESRAIITSLNLHKFSYENNIEVGIVVDRKSIIGSFLSNGDVEYDAHNYFEKVIKASVLKFKKDPIFKSTMLGFSSEYIGSEEKVNIMNELYPKYNFIEHQRAQNNISGYCIRTGTSIPFNPKRPFCSLAYNKWSEFENDSYPEKFCHFSGELSNGETSFRQPILKKNWKASQNITYDRR